MTGDLAAFSAFFAARLNEEEAEVKGPPGWRLEHWIAVKYADKDSGRNWRVDAEPRCIVDSVVREDAQYIARHNPARALREVEAKRAILARCLQAIEAQGIYMEDGQEALALDVLAQLATTWRVHPDYKPLPWPHDV